MSGERSTIDQAQEAIIRFVAALREMESRGATGTVTLELNLNAGKVLGVAKILTAEHRRIELVKAGPAAR